MVIQKSVVFFFLLLLVQVSQAAEKQAYTLQKLIQINLLLNKQGQWLDLIEQPKNKGSFFLANSQGKIYQLGVGELVKTSLLFDLKRLALPVDILKLSAFTLHPDFSRRGSSGFGKFYTAHVENFSQDTKTRRIMDSNVDIPLSFDAVLTQWQLDLTNNLVPSSRLEIVRIAIPELNDGFQQVSFNPHSKSWHNDFAQLYLSLAQSQSLKEYPIYSGAILRIQPPSKALKKKFYSIPKTNPYFANNEIEDALYVFGAGKIKQFNWPNKHSSKLLISHQYPFNYSITNWLSLSEGGEDWRKTAPKVPLYKSTESIATHSLLSYNGKNVLTLRKKLLFLISKNQQWQLSSLDLEHLTTSPEEFETTTIPPPNTEWSLMLQTLNTDQLGIYPDNFGEILVFNKATGIIYQVFQPEVFQEPSDQSTFQLPLLIKLIVALFIFILMCFTIKIIKQKISIKKIARNHFTKITLADNKSNIELFRRDLKVPSVIIPLTGINQCQVCLGQKVLTTISYQPNKNFNSTKETDLRELFRIEQIAKMVECKVRRISLVITDKDNSKFTVCLYLRQGSERITKKNYFDVVDDVIWWCWLVNEQITPSQTGIRATADSIREVNLNLREKHSFDHASLQTQAAVIRPATQHDLKELKYPPVQIENIEKNQDTNTNTAYPKSREIDLVYALEKLVKLQQQGFLTALEFKQAKAKLLDGNN